MNYAFGIDIGFMMQTIYLNHTCQSLPFIINCGRIAPQVRSTSTLFPNENTLHIQYVEPIPIRDTLYIYYYMPPYKVPSNLRLLL